MLSFTIILESHTYTPTYTHTDTHTQQQQQQQQQQLITLFTEKWNPKEFLLDSFHRTFKSPFRINGESETIYLP